MADFKLVGGTDDWNALLQMCGSEQVVYRDHSPDGNPMYSAPHSRYCIEFLCKPTEAVS